MSEFVFGYDDEESLKFFEVKVYYDTYEPYYGNLGNSSLSYTIPGSVEVTCVEVMYVECYDEEGMLIAKSTRPEPVTEVWKKLDAEAENKVCEWVAENRELAEDLWNNR